MTTTEQTIQGTLPALTGSPKQIAWAESIRAEAMSAWEAAKPNLIEVETERWGEELPAEKVERIEQAIIGTDAFIARQTRAAFWIDNRGIEFASIYKQLGRNIYTGIYAKGQMTYENGGVGPLNRPAR